MSTRVKLGPYKVPAEFWQRMQQLPGGNDEQRVIMALDFACGHIENQVAQRAAVDTRIAQLVEHERAKQDIGTPLGMDLSKDITVEAP